MGVWVVWVGGAHLSLFSSEDPVLPPPLPLLPAARLGVSQDVILIAPNTTSYQDQVAATGVPAYICAVWNVGPVTADYRLSVKVT